MGQRKYSFMNHSSEEDTTPKKKRFHTQFGKPDAPTQKRFFTGKKKSQDPSGLDESARRFMIGARQEDGDRVAAYEAKEEDAPVSVVPRTLWDQVKYVIVDMFLRALEVGIAAIAHEIFLFFSQRRLLPSHFYGGTFA